MLNDALGVRLSLVANVMTIGREADGEIADLHGMIGGIADGDGPDEGVAGGFESFGGLEVVDRLNDAGRLAVQAPLEQTRGGVGFKLYLQTDAGRGDGLEGGLVEGVGGDRGLLLLLDILPIVPCFVEYLPGDGKFGIETAAGVSSPKDFGGVDRLRLVEVVFDPLLAGSFLRHPSETGRADIVRGRWFKSCVEYTRSWSPDRSGDACAACERRLQPVDRIARAGTLRASVAAGGRDLVPLVRAFGTIADRDIAKRLAGLDVICRVFVLDLLEAGDAGGRVRYLKRGDRRRLADGSRNGDKRECGNPDDRVQDVAEATSGCCHDT